MSNKEIIKEGRRKYRGHRDVFGKPLRKGPRKSQPIPLAKGWRTKQRNKKLGLHRGQGEFKDPKPFGKEGRSILDHKTYSRIYNLLTEVGKPELEQSTAPKSWKDRHGLGSAEHKRWLAAEGDTAKRATLGIKQDRRKGNYGSRYSSRTRGRRSGDTD